MAQTDIQVEEKVKVTLKQPSKWAVVYVNDEKNAHGLRDQHTDQTLSIQSRTSNQNDQHHSQ